MTRSLLMKAWRVAAIYRCCLRHGADEAWALRRLREIFPDGSRDHEVENWFTDMTELRARRQPQPDLLPLPLAA